MYKKILSTSIVLCSMLVCFDASASLGGDSGGGGSCEYMGKLEQCIAANKNGSARSIKEFPCLQTDSQEAMMDQIILAKLFDEIQEKKIQYLLDLRRDKEAVVDDMNRAIDDVEKNFANEGVFFKDYKEICNEKILEERSSCGDISLLYTGKRAKNDGNVLSECMDLAETHLAIFKTVGYDTLALNKADVHKDDHQEHIEQKQRGKYGDILSLMAAIQGHMGRLVNGITHYTRNPLQATVIKTLFKSVINRV